MTFVDAIKNGFVNFANFRGRAGRAEFWYWVLFYVLVSLVAGTVDNTSGTQTVGNLVSLAFLIPNLSISARRFRDAGVNPWLLLLQILPVIVLIWLIVQMITSFLAIGTDVNSTLETLGDEAALAALLNSPAMTALYFPLIAFVVSAIGVTVFFLVVYLRPSIPGGSDGGQAQGFGDTTA